MRMDDLERKMTEHQCWTDYAYGVDGEYCRTNCTLYGTGRCRYDPDTGKMMVKDEGESQ